MGISVRRTIPACILAASLWLSPGAHTGGGDVGGTIFPRQIAIHDAGRV
jgi:hypothetical protein